MACDSDAYYLENRADGNCLFDSLAQIWLHVSVRDTNLLVRLYLNELMRPHANALVLGTTFMRTSALKRKSA